MQPSLCRQCLRRSWRLVQCSSSGVSPPAACGGRQAAARHASSSHSLPPIRKHRRHVTRLEQAAEIGMQALRAAAAEPPAAAAAPSLLPPQLLQQAAALQQQQQQQQPQQPPKKRVGVLQRVPVIPPADELAASALKRALRVTPGAGIKNEAEKERSRAAKQLDTHMKELSVPLGRFVKAFPLLPSLHPFEAALLDLSVGAATYASVLGKVDALRKSLQQVGKGFAARASSAPNKRAAAALAEEGSAALGGVFAKGSKALDDLKRVSRVMRGLPSVDPSLPTLTLVGAPNVGKSSLVRLLSSGTPEVCNYPFTTRSIKMGHFYVNGRRHQVTDTPGLLPRPDGQRNKMELLTLAALEHLPSSVVFVADLTEGCGSSVAEQWEIRDELQRRFAGKPWVDVLSKADLLGDVWAAAQQQGGLQTTQQQQQGGLQTQQQQEVQQEVQREGSGGSSAAVQDAVQFAAALPGAVRVSSLTEEGLEQLQASLLGMLQSPAAAAEAAAAAGLLLAGDEEGGGEVAAVGSAAGLPPPPRI